jgi:hypothetical protein
VVAEDLEAPTESASDDLARLDRQTLYRLHPERLYPHWLVRCRVRILLVTDQGGSFGGQNFGLGELISMFDQGPSPWATFSVTTANRRTDPTAQRQDFRFTDEDLHRYDQIWLIGVERSNGLHLTEPELRAISEFMDQGGGVFATGDHEDLGVALCGRVPRVRNMRKWHWPGPGPLGEPVAPPVGGPNRLDTLSEGGDPGVQFDDQSDDVPQKISPRMYSSGSFSPYFYRTYPHPVLCGPRGVIRVLPDHPHEGECYVPSDLSAAHTFDDYTIEEYPALASGVRLAPEVIAWSHITGGRTAQDVKGLLNARTFGAIGAWDGHRVGHGRVVVQATWHHLFNINLVGVLGSGHPVKSQGFKASASGEAALADIRDYFRNVAIWLSRRPTIRCIRWRQLWWLRWHHQFVMDLRPQFVGRFRELDLPELLRIGTAARDVLGRQASQCESWQLARWLLPVRREPWDWLLRLVDPWRPLPERPEPSPDPVVWLHAERLLDAALGAAIYSVAERFPEASEEARDEASQIELDEILVPAADLALERVGEQSRSIARELEIFSRQLG